jgi:hypothetical protein
MVDRGLFTNDPQTPRVGVNAEYGDNRLTVPVPFPFRWPESRPFDRLQATNSLLFYMKGRPGDDTRVQRVLSLDQINSTARTAWTNYINDISTSRNAQPQSKLAVLNMGTKYKTGGEAAYYSEPGWSDGSAFHLYPEAARFTWMSNLSIHNAISPIGPKITPGEYSANPGVSLTAVNRGYAKILNYWGPVSTGDDLYLVVKQSKNGKGPFELVPLVKAGAIPTSFDREYIDAAGNIRYGGCWKIGKVMRQSDVRPTESMIKLICGRDGNSNEQVYKRCQHAPCIDIAVDIRTL